MPHRDEPWPDGTPCWVDLSSPDVDGAERFYADVLGWRWREAADDPQYGGYRMAEVEGRAAAGMAPAQDPSAPSSWTLYVAASDVDATAERVSAAGGQVVAGPFDVGPVGRMAIAVDPQGSSFGLWQAAEHLGVEVYNAPGALVWEEIGLTDPAAGRAFYGATFGWDFQEMQEMPGYETFHLGGDPLGGSGSPDQVGTAGWQVCFGCADTDVAVAAATDGGGSVLFGPEDSPYGRFAVLVDPWGARFAVMGMG